MSIPERECPMCTANMRLVNRQVTTPLPGTNRSKTTTTKEWICPDCDYFEEADPEEGVEPEGR